MIWKPSWLMWGGAVILAAALAGGIAYMRGYAAATHVWEAKYTARENELLTAQVAEIQRQARANEAAKQIESARIAVLVAAHDAMTARIEELNREADADPDRDRLCLSADSVRRISKIRD